MARECIKAGCKLLRAATDARSVGAAAAAAEAGRQLQRTYGGKQGTREEREMERRPHDGAREACACALGSAGRATICISFFSAVLGEQSVTQSEKRG